LRRSGSPPDRRSRTSAGDLSRIGPTRAGDGPRTGAPYLVPAALALATALAGWAFRDSLASCGRSLETPETQIRKALANQQRAHLDDVYGFRAGGTVELFGVRFEDVAPVVEQGRADVVAMLTAEGRAAWRDQDAKLAYVGRERFHMRPCSIALWCGEGDQFSRMRAVLITLFRRVDAVEQRDADAHDRLLSPRYSDRGEDRDAARRRLARELAGPARRVRVLGWQIRVERETADVGEDVEIAAAGKPPHRERHVYRLERDGERWLFAGGL
jgi:hypothetical protein